MADSYVCSGAMMRCTMGTSPAKLTVLPIRTVFLTGQPMANISDHLSMVNLASFGLCRSMGFPSTASATAANHGTLTPMPCMHNTPFPWMNGKNDYIVKGDPALLKSSTCQCMWGGTISIIDDGQHGEGAQWVSKSQEEEFEIDQIKTDGLTADDILDGIQIALDVAGMAPVAGAIPDLANAAISALRGDWLGAGLSLAAAVPGAGDAVGAAKIAKDGVKLAKVAKASKLPSEAVKGTEKVMNELTDNMSKEKLWGKRAKMLEDETGIKVEYDPKNSETLYDSVDPDFGIETPEFKKTKGNPFSPQSKESDLTNWDQEEISERSAWDDIQKSSEEKGWNPYTVKETTTKMDNQPANPTETLPSRKEFRPEDITSNNNKTLHNNLKDFKWHQSDAASRYPKKNFDE